MLHEPGHFLFQAELLLFKLGQPDGIRTGPVLLTGDDLFNFSMFGVE